MIVAGCDVGSLTGKAVILNVDVFVQKLTERQKEILQLIAEGHLAKEIADILCISARTFEA